MTEVTWTWPQIFAILVMSIVWISIIVNWRRKTEADIFGTIASTIIWLWILSAGGFWQ